MSSRGFSSCVEQWGVGGGGRGRKSERETETDRHPSSFSYKDTNPTLVMASKPNQLPKGRASKDYDIRG